MTQGMDDETDIERTKAEIFEEYRKLSKQLGSSEPVIEALAQSFGLFGNAGQREDYDRLRKELVQYLRSVDDADVEVPSQAPEFQHSPDVTNDRVASIARALDGLAKKPDES